MPNNQCANLNAVYHAYLELMQSDYRSHRIFSKPQLKKALVAKGLEIKRAKQTTKNTNTRTNVDTIKGYVLITSAFDFPTNVVPHIPAQAPPAPSAQSV